jgi:hypothetical protein
MPRKTKRLTKKEIQAAHRKQVLACANSVNDFLEDFSPFSSYDLKQAGTTVRLRSLPACRLDVSERTQIERLFCTNMQRLYEQSSWGFNIEKKRMELFHAHARFLIVSMDETPDVIEAFLHFRFIEDEGVEVVYVYEIQVGEKVQRNGMGKRLMQLLILIGRKYHMKFVMLTVFKANTAAMSFYMKTMGFDIDETSPSLNGNPNESYEILSKSLVRL